MRLFSLLYSWHSVAPFDSASFTRPSMKSALLLLTTGTMAASSSGMPTVSFAMPAFTCDQPSRQLKPCCGSATALPCLRARRCFAYPKAAREVDSYKGATQNGVRQCAAHAMLLPCYGGGCKRT